MKLGNVRELYIYLNKYAKGSTTLHILVKYFNNAMDDGVYVSLTHEPLNPMKIMDLVRSPEAGAIVLFAGTTRNNFDGISFFKTFTYHRQKGDSSRL
jgi:hypothetical protein